MVIAAKSNTFSVPVKVKGYVRESASPKVLPSMPNVVQNASGSAINSRLLPLKIGRKKPSRRQMSAMQYVTTDKYFLLSFFVLIINLRQ